MSNIAPLSQERIKQISVLDIQRMYSHGKKIIMLTAYDYPFSRLVDLSGVPLLLVGDSVGTVVQGQSTTIPVTLDEIIYHCRLVMRGVKQVMVIADMPFMSFQLGPKEALQSAGRLLKEGGASAVKVEGGASVTETVKRIVEASIPVMGHLGLQPQSFHAVGGYRVQGKTKENAERLLEDAWKIQEAGAFAIVLECIPAELAAKVTSELSIPTIGIGAGPSCSGQVLVIHDLLGLSTFPGETLPKFVKQYTSLGDSILAAIKKFASEVEEGKFPSEEHCYR